jgi:hypothetical protein
MMSTKTPLAVLALSAAIAVAILGVCELVAAPPGSTDVPVLPNVDEARGRAELLHETFHAVLHAVHQQYFREDDGVPIPAATLDQVFQELSKRQRVEIRWLAVNATPMNVDNRPRNDFERKAVDAIASGSDSVETVDPGLYRRVGAIALTSDCLKCHLPSRRSTEARSAGLVIAIPIAKP